MLRAAPCAESLPAGGKKANRHHAGRFNSLAGDGAPTRTRYGINKWDTIYTGSVLKRYDYLLVILIISPGCWYIACLMSQFEGSSIRRNYSDLGVLLPPMYSNRFNPEPTAHQQTQLQLLQDTIETENVSETKSSISHSTFLSSK